MNRLIASSGFLAGIFVIMLMQQWYNNNIGDDRCYETFQYEAFYSVNHGIEYCFYRKREYPYSIKGGVIGVKT